MKLWKSLLALVVLTTIANGCCCFDTCCNPCGNPCGNSCSPGYGANYAPPATSYSQPVRRPVVSSAPANMNNAYYGPTTVGALPPGPLSTF